MIVVAPQASAFGLYGAGGLCAYGDIIYRAEFLGIPLEEHEPLGTSFWLGGGGAVPLWRYDGAVRPALELATDVGFGRHSEPLETGDLAGQELAFKVIAPRELILFAVGVGPGGAIRPFAGFGGGVPWSVTDPTTGVQWDSHTEVKAAFGIPFGCEFFLAPKFALMMRADYLVITGDATPEVENELVRTALPDAFLFCGGVRADL